jgi:hypothetical protein
MLSNDSGNSLEGGHVSSRTRAGSMILGGSIDGDQDDVSSGNRLADIGREE